MATSYLLSFPPFLQCQAHILLILNLLFALFHTYSSHTYRKLYSYICQVNLCILP